MGLDYHRATALRKAFSAPFIDNLDPEVLSVAYDASPSDIEYFLKDIHDVAENAQEQLEQRRLARPMRKANAKAQRFVLAIHDFLKSFPALAELAKSTPGSSYGGIGFAALALLVTIAKNKEIYDTQAAKAVATTGQWLSRIQILVKNHSNETGLNQKIRARALDIYEQTVMILGFVTKYYTSSSIRRNLRAVFKPPQGRLEELLKDFKEKVADLMNEHTVVQSTRIKEMSDHINEMKKSLETGRQKDQLQELSERFDLPFDRDYGSKMITRCMKACDDIPDYMLLAGEDSTRKTPLLRGSLDLLETNKPYQDWKSAKTSGLLVLSGENAKSDITVPSWLSPMGLEFYRNIKGCKESLVVFVPVEYVAGSTRQNSRWEPTILDYILYQLLQQDASLCDQTIAELRKGKEAIDSTDRSEPAFERLRTTLKTLARGTCCYLIIDGVILLTTGQQKPLDFIRSLRNIVLDPEVKATVKVMAFTRSLFWPEIEGRCLNSREPTDELARELNFSKSQRNKIFATLGWEQKRLNTVD